MKKYKTRRPVPLMGGVIKFENEKLAERFGEALKKTKTKGAFEIAKPITLKVGVAFEYDGDIPKRHAESLEPPEDEKDSGGK